MSTTVMAHVLCEYEPTEGSRRVRLLYVDEPDRGMFLADAWDGEDWTDSTPEEFDQIVVACLYEFWQHIRKFKSVD